MADLSGNLDLIEELNDCPYCHFPGKRALLIKNHLRIVKCLKCGLGYTDRRWNRRGALLYYQEGYYTGQVKGAYKDYRAEQEEKLVDFVGKYNVLKKFVHGGLLLDVGCATGVSLLAAQAVGFTPEGVEWSAWAVQQNKTGLPVFCGELTTLAGRSRYDVISMWDVIEHLFDPASAFRNLHELLRRKGLLIFTYPDPTSWLARMLGKKWWALTPEEHYFFYTPRILEDWLGQFGFRRLYECHEKRAFSLGKLAQKTMPSVEDLLNRAGIAQRVVSLSIPYKRMAIFRKS